MGFKSKKTLYYCQMSSQYIIPYVCSRNYARIHKENLYTDRYLVCTTVET